jgi:predicted ATPase
MRSWRLFHFHDASRSAGVKQPCQVDDDNLTRREDGSNLAAVLYRTHSREPTSYQRILKSVQQVAPFFEAFTLHPAG